MNESYTILWVQAFDVAILVAAVGCLLGRFTKKWRRLCLRSDRIQVRG